MTCLCIYWIIHGIDKYSGLRRWIVVLIRELCPLLSSEGGSAEMDITKVRRLTLVKVYSGSRCPVFTTVRLVAALVTGIDVK